MASVSEILLEQGRSRANARRQQGNLQAGMWTNLADVVSGTLTHINREREEAPIRAQNAQIRQAQIDSITSEQQSSERLRALFSREQPPTQEELIAAAGPERGMALAKELKSLEVDPMANEERMLRIERLVQEIRQANAPKAPTLTQVDPTKDLYTDGELTRPGVPEEKPDTRTLQQQANDAGRKGDWPEYQRIMKVLSDTAAAGRDPREPQGTPMWAKDPQSGQVRLMTPDEVRRIGATQPDTADMRNKEAGKRTAARAVDAVRALGGKIITRVGPAQRIEAVKRGVEAVFGNDPEFQTYQDSRMALAGTLAVEQQGARVSDADVKALWLPMVPDAYRDTAESYKLKWELINAMRGVDQGATPPPPGGAGRVYHDAQGNPVTNPVTK